MAQVRDEYLVNFAKKHGLRIIESPLESRNSSKRGLNDSKCSVSSNRMRGESQRNGELLQKSANTTCDMSCFSSLSISEASSTRNESFYEQELRRQKEKTQKRKIPEMQTMGKENIQVETTNGRKEPKEREKKRKMRLRKPPQSQQESFLKEIQLEKNLFALGELEDNQSAFVESEDMQKTQKETSQGKPPVLRNISNQNGGIGFEKRKVSVSKVTKESQNEENMSVLTDPNNLMTSCCSFSLTLSSNSLASFKESGSLAKSGINSLLQSRFSSFSGNSKGNLETKNREPPKTQESHERERVIGNFNQDRQAHRENKEDGSMKEKQGNINSKNTRSSSATSKTGSTILSPCSMRGCGHPMNLPQAFNGVSWDISKISEKISQKENIETLKELQKALDATSYQDLFQKKKLMEKPMVNGNHRFMRGLHACGHKHSTIQRNQEILLEKVKARKELQLIMELKRKNLE